MRLNDSLMSQRNNLSSLLDKSMIRPISKEKNALIEILRDNSATNLTQKQQKFNFFTYYQKLPLIRPENYFLVIWYFLILLIILYYIFQVGLLIAFGQVVWVDQIEHLYLLHILFYLVLVLDIFISPLKMYYSSGILIKDRKLISKQYFKFHFWLDLIALISIMIPFFDTSNFYINLTKIFFLPKLYTARQINKYIQKIFVFHNKLQTLFLMARLVVFLILCAHCIGVGFFYIDHWIYTNNYYGPNTPNICWIYNSEAIYQLILVWDWPEQYIYVLYFSIGMTNTIAYGDITPINPMETLYITLALIFNTLAFGYILAQAMRILIQAFYAQFSYEQLQNIAINLLQQKRISRKLSNSIRCHLEQIFDVQMYRNRKIQKQVIDTLPFQMKYSLYLQIHKYFIYKLFSINKFSKFLERIVDFIHEERFISGNIVYSQNQEYSQQINTHKVYFIKEYDVNLQVVLGVGKPPLLSQDNFGESIWTSCIEIYKPKQLFGHVQFFTGKRRSHWCLSKSNILIYHLSRKNLVENLKFANKQELQNIYLITQQIQTQSCFICQRNHNFICCPFVKYLPNPLEIIYKNHQKYQMKRRNSVWIKQKRQYLKSSSEKYNALSGFKILKKQISANSTFKSKLKMFMTSKKYQKYYLEGLSSSDQSQSSESSQDLDTMIEQTKILIKNYSRITDGQLLQQKLYWQEFEIPYQWEFYKKQQNMAKEIQRFQFLLQKERMDRNILKIKNQESQKQQQKQE